MMKVKENEVMELKKQLRDLLLGNKGGGGNNEGKNRVQQLEDDLGDAMRQVEELKGMRDKLREANVAKNDWERRAKEMSDRLAGANKRHQEDKVVMEEKLAGAKAMVDTHQRRESDLRCEVEALKNEIEGLKKSLADVTTTAETTRISRER